MFTINAMERKELGKGASRRLRAANRFPAIIYGSSEATIAVDLDQEQVMNMQTTIDFYKEVLILVLDGREIKVKVQAIQRHPYKPKLHHIDFIRA